MHLPSSPVRVLYMHRALVTSLHRQLSNDLIHADRDHPLESTVRAANLERQAGVKDAG